MKIRILIIFLASLLFESTAQNTLTYSSNDSHYRNGLEYYERSNYAAAKQEFSKFLENSPDAEKYYNHDQINAEYYITICGLYLDAPEADIDAQRFVARHPNHPKSASLFRELGSYYFAKENYERALDFYKNVNKRLLPINTQAEIGFKQGMSYYKTKQMEPALAAFSEAKNLDVEPYSSGSSYYSGVVNYNLERYENAILDFKKVEKNPAYQSEAPIWIAQSYLKQEKLEDIVKYAEPLMKAKSTEKYLGELAMLLGNIFFDKQDYSKAAQYLDVYKSQTRTKRNEEAMYRLGYSQYKLKKYTEAIENLRSGATRNDALGQYSSYYLGVCYLNKQSLNDALAAFDAAKRLDFDLQIKEDASFNKAKLEIALGYCTNGINSLLDFTKKFPKSGYINEANELLSDAYLSTNNYTAAISYIESLKNKTDKINNIYQKMTYNQGVTEYNAEKYDKAIFYLIKSENNGPNAELVNEAMYLKGESFYQQKKYKEALATFEEINAPIDLKNKALYSSAYVYFTQKNYTKAAELFKDYTNKVKGQKGSSYSDAMARLADCYMAQKNYAAAQQVYDIVALSGEAEKDYALYQKAQTLIYQGKEADAKSSLEKIVKEYPASPYADDALYKVGEIELNNGNTTTAINRFTLLLQSKPNSEWVPNALLKRAIANTNLKNYDASIADYRTILRKYGTDDVAESALLGLQDVLNSAGRPEEFSQDLAEYKKKNPTATSTEALEYETAKNVYFSQNYGKAITALTNFLKNYPYSTSAIEARFFLADSYNRSNNKANALKYYYEVIASNNSDFLARAAFRAADIEQAIKNYPKAISNFRLLLQATSNKRDQQVAITGLMNSYFEVKNYDSTIVFAKDLQAVVGPGNEVYNKASLQIAKAFWGRGDKNRANIEFENIAKTNKDEVGAEAKLYQALLAYESKNYKQSIELCKQLNNDFADYESWRGKAFLLIADNYIAQNDTLNAKAVLNSIIDNSPDLELVDQAKSKLSNLK